LGRYPFVEPSRCLGRTQGEAQLAALMAPPAPPSPWVSSASSGSGSGSSDGDDEAAAAINAANEYDGSVPSSSLVNNGNPGAGVRTFFSLQAELPPQSAMPVGGAGGGFLPYKAAAELIHAALSPPPPQECVDGLRNPTLDKFLPPRKRATSQAYDAFRKRESALSFVHCPVEDLGVPSMGQLKKAVAELAERLAKAEAARRRQQAAGGGGGADAPAAAASPSTEAGAAGSILLHCWGGRGRAGLVGACLLVAAYGLSAEEALLRVQRAFDTRRDNGRLSPETDEQRELVRAFEREVR
jgi:alanine transaminase